LKIVIVTRTVPTIVEDLDGNIQDLNDETVNAYGWTREELLGKPIKILLPEYMHEQTGKLLERCRAGETMRNVEGVRRKKDGTEIPVLLTLSLLTGEGDEPAGIATIASDITERKKAEETVIKLKDELEIKVAERTEELQERVKELERFHEATLDRELRIKELRDRIEELEKKIERLKLY